jgi:ABC-2 type transport system permease protein
MLAQLLRFEVKYHFRQITFIAAAALFFSLGILMTRGSFGGAEVHKNGPYVIGFIICLLSLFMIFVSMLFCGSVVLRDKTYRMDALVYPTALNKKVHFNTRLAGLLLSVFLIMCLAMLGILAGAMMVAYDQKGELNPLFYLQPLFVFGLPNVLFCSSLLFATAILTQNLRAVYVCGVALFILYFVASILGNSPLMASSTLKPGGPDLVSILSDPLGITAFFGETRNWSVIRRNQELFPLSSTFVANRLLWTSISLLALAVSYRFSVFGPAAEKRVKKSKNIAVISKITTYRTVTSRPRGFNYLWAAFRSQLRLESSSLFKQPLFMVIVALWMFLYAIELKENIFHGPYHLRFYATTALVIEQLLPVKLALLLLVFYGSELVHRERASHMEALIFSTPVPVAILYLAKTGVLCVLIVLLIGCNIIVGLGLQLIAGIHQMDLLPYLSLLYYSGFQLLLSAVLIIFVQTVVPHKYLGMLVSLVVVGISVFGKLLGIEYNLLRFGSAPALTYSAINGFGHHAGSFHVYMFFWTIVSILLGVLTCRWWLGGSQDTWLKRIEIGLKHWNTTLRVVVSAALLTLACTSFYIVKNSKGITPGKNGKANVLWQKHYEQNYKSAASVVQPVIHTIKISTEIYPHEKRYAVKGFYIVRNESDTPIEKLWIGVDPGVASVAIQVPGAGQKTFDEAFRQGIYDLKNPLLPGAEMVIPFSMKVSRSGFLPANSENSVVSNGSYIELEKYLPFFGYNSGYELDDPQVRKENGLGARTTPRETDHRYHLVHFENTISTDADQQVVTVGMLQKSWKSGERRYFHYKTEQPVQFMFAVSSARYAVMQETHNGIAYRIFYQPGQTHNLPAMMQAMKDAIDYGWAEFGPYPLKQLTLAEIPAYPGSATAYPGVIFSNEKFNFLVDVRDSTRFNFIYATTVHEAAHQWWANKIRPQNGPGYALLTESLAKYTEAMVAEKRLGKMLLREYLQTDNQLYFSLRNTPGEKELPLVETLDLPFVHYQKGGLALYALKETLGEKRLNQALRSLVSRFSAPHNRPAPADLVQALYTQASPGERKVIADHLKKVITYDNRIAILSCVPAPGGRFKIRLRISVRKTDQTGTKQENPEPDDLMDIALFAEEETSWNRGTKPIYLQKHPFNKTETILEIVADHKPKLAALDPFGYILDENREDNISHF